MATAAGEQSNTPDRQKEENERIRWVGGRAGGMVTKDRPGREVARSSRRTPAAAAPTHHTLRSKLVACFTVL